MREQGLYLPDVIGQGYGEFWRSKKRYVVVKGSRASKKSKTTALWHVVHMMKHPTANTLCVRKTERTLLSSCYADIQWACNRLGVSKYWRFTKNPLEITYIPHGNKILFRGCDDVLKLTSISVPVGNLCWCWIEEAYELNETMFQTIDESIRGELADPTLFKRLTLTFNPWHSRSFLKKRFFDNPDEDTLALTRNYQVNEWLDEADLKVFEMMKRNNPTRYKTAGCGEWGVDSEGVYENWEEKLFTLEDLEDISDIEETVGLDFGWQSPSALIHSFVSNKRKEIYIWDEWEETKANNDAIYEAIVERGLQKNIIYADSAAPREIEDLYAKGLTRIRKAIKGNGSKFAGIRKIQECRIFVHPRCVKTITELSCYAWKKDKMDVPTDVPMDEFDHLMDAMLYSVVPKLKESLFSFD